MERTLKIFQKYIQSGKSFSVKLLGDSITHGVGGSGFAQDGYPFINGFARNPNGFCWANLFKEHLEKKYDAEVVNNAATGTRVEFIIQNFDTLVDDSDDIVICAIGTNNRHQQKGNAIKKTREEFAKAFYDNVVLLNKKFKETQKEVIFIANIPAAPENELDGENYWRILHMDDINEIYKRASQEEGFCLISLYDLFSGYLKENNIDIHSTLKDGLHPNDEGYKIIYQLLLKEFAI